VRRFWHFITGSVVLCETTAIGATVVHALRLGGAFNAVYRVVVSVKPIVVKIEVGPATALAILILIVADRCISTS
jgi:hypothetical protein